MARKRSRGNLIDYLVAAIEPALIMVMVTSLMYFLLDVWFDEKVLDRLHYLLFWFVFGIVLITRISMQIGNELAKGYGLVLGGAVALVATVLAGFQPFLIVVMGTVWWATHKLTYDCTLMDEDQDTGVGLLQQSGLDVEALADDGGDMSGGSESIDDPAAMHTTLMPDRPRWKFWEKDSEATRRPHAPGVWLIYFTVGSIPVFALGQLLLPSVKEDRRVWLSIYFLAYMASGMGLLLATSFLNLRRYLRRRKLKMPAAMTATWLTTGAMMIVGLTVATALLPIPLSSLSSARESSNDLSHLSASKHAILKDSGVQGEGAQSEGPAAAKSDGKQQASGKPEGSGKTNDPNARQQTNGQGKEGGNSGQGKSKSGAAKGKASSSKNGQQGKSGKANDQAGDRAKGQNKAGDQAKGQDQARGQDRSEDKAESKENAEQGEQKDGQQNGDKSSQDSSSQSSSPGQMPNPAAFALPALSMLRTPIIVIGIIIMIFGAIRYGRELLEILKSLLLAILSIFGFGWKSEREGRAPQDEEKPQPPPRPFSAYANPFHTGLDHQLTPDDLIVYSFEALEAWAYEQEMGRAPHETPMEFASRLGEVREQLGPDAARLVAYFMALVYGQRGFRSEVLPPLRQFWDALQATPAR